MKTYHLRNILSEKDQQKHVYIKLSNGLLIDISECEIKEVNGVLVIEFNK